MRIQRRYGWFAVLLLSLAFGGGCGGGDGDKAAASPEPVASSSSEPEDGMVTITDAWVKVAASGTTPIFGTLVNGTSNDLTVVSAVTESAQKIDLVELVDRKTLQPKPGGFLVPAHGSHDLKPEGDRLVLVDLTRPLAAGDLVTIVLHFEDRSTLQFRAGAKEGNPEVDAYQPR
jgi:copper(I)-binding protein